MGTRADREQARQARTQADASGREQVGRMRPYGGRGTVGTPSPARTTGQAQGRVSRQAQGWTTQDGYGAASSRQAARRSSASRRATTDYRSTAGRRATDACSATASRRATADYRSRRTGSQARPTSRQATRHAARQSPGAYGAARARRFAAADLLAKLAPVAAALAALVVLVLLIGSCTRGCAPAATGGQTTSSTSLMARASAKLGTAPKSAFSQAGTGSLQSYAATFLSHDENVASIASRTTPEGSYAGLGLSDSYRAMSLSVRQPQASGFARALPEATTDTEPYRGSITQGTAPILYQWDERWGYYRYCDMPLGFSGCGVTVMSMAYMGLTGKTDLTPDKMADLSVNLGEAEGGTNSTFFVNDEMTATTGVAGARLDDTADALVESLQAGAFVAVHVRANTLAGGGHWVLATGVSDDGTLRINDPNSPANTAKSWSTDELMGYADAMIALSLSA